MSIMQHIVQVESAGNPYAIGVVNGKLSRQPRNLVEALKTVKMLESKGYNFSVGISQVNRYNLKPYGLHSYEQAFQICPNLQAGSKILKECYDRSKHWGKSFSCYYSGNFVTGYRHGYVRKIMASMQRAQLAKAEYPNQLSNVNMVEKIMVNNKKVAPKSNIAQAVLKQTMDKVNYAELTGNTKQYLVTQNQLIKSAAITKSLSSDTNSIPISETTKQQTNINMPTKTMGRAEITQQEISTDSAFVF